MSETALCTVWCRRASALSGLVLLGLSAAACDDLAPRKTRQAPSAFEGSIPPSLIGRPSAPEPSAIPPDREAREGAPTPEAVYTRAQELLQAKDFLALVYTIRPETRRRWVADLAVALALESVDDGADSDWGRRRGRADARRLLVAFGATATVDKGSGVSVEALQKRLFEHVHDPDGFLAAMLIFANGHDCGIDPLCVVGPSGLDGVARPEETHGDPHGARDTLNRALVDAGVHPASSASARRSEARVSVEAAGIARLFARIRAPHRLSDVKLDGESGSGITEAPEFQPVRFYRSNGITWLDES